MGHLGVVLYEYLGEEYPEVLGSILGALKSIVNVIGKTFVLESFLCCPPLTIYGQHFQPPIPLFSYRNAQDDSSNQGPASQAYSHPEEQTREGAGELHRSGWEDCRSWSRVCKRKGMDAHLFRTARVIEGNITWSAKTCSENDITHCGFKSELGLLVHVLMVVI